MLLGGIAISLLGGIALSLLLMALLGPGQTSADHIPQPPKEFTYRLDFEATRPDMFGPNGAVPGARDVSFFDFDWDKRQTLDATLRLGGTFEIFGEPVTVPQVGFGAKLTAGAEGDIFVGAKIEGFDQAGNIGIKYPIEVTLSVPRADTFRRGEIITIGSSGRLLPGGGPHHHTP